MKRKKLKLRNELFLCFLFFFLLNEQNKKYYGELHFFSQENSGILIAKKTNNLEEGLLIQLTGTFFVAEKMREGLQVGKKK